MIVFIVKLTDGYDNELIRVTKTSKKAYEICEEFIKNVDGYLEEIREEMLRDLEQSYKRHRTYFWTECTDVEPIEVEE